MKTNNEKNVNKDLIDHLLSGKENTNGETAPTEEDNGPELASINLCSCRFAFSVESIDWDACDVEDITKLRDQFVTARFNLITTEDVEERAKIADAILKDVHDIELNLGLSVDYYNIRTDITKFEAALLAICDAITIYDWHINQIHYLEYMKNLSAFIEDDNIDFVNSMAASYVPPEGDPKEPDYILDPSVVDQLGQSFIDDHNESGLITE